MAGQKEQHIIFHEIRCTCCEVLIATATRPAEGVWCLHCSELYLWLSEQIQLLPPGNVEEFNKKRNADRDKEIDSWRMLPYACRIWKYL